MKRAVPSLHRSPQTDKANPVGQGEPRQQEKSYLVGLIGQAIQASRSPALHQHEAEALGLRYQYRLIDLDTLGRTAADLPELLADAERLGFDGLNITHPCKQAVIPYLDELSEDARAIGAVNTVTFVKGRRIGTNTDAWGFAESFRRFLPKADLARVVQLGAGGAGAATAHAILSLGASQLEIFDLDRGRADSLADSLCQRYGAGRAVSGHDLAVSMSAGTGLIHSTPTGMVDHPGLPLPAELLQSRHWVAEIVYFPLVTPLLSLARRLGCPTIDGGGMAVFQAVASFEIFTGHIPDSERMLRDFASMAAE
jgi:shikimate dehydrogenase